ncbi:transcriptional activator protein acu-15 [Sporothrix schenckii 1099-18]|uniref:Transcriptional activator protein acu-15 n=1 Tax=Sporothrix schenckii 1099-18 TaxID=1397361 RepID=A0A0F2LZX3_SPOSC|nr:transcriptional activator protein acu-15 [Sporothrix schenckii 1099-18]KJR82997.1 transcriptional activator protein acu-15 [Sporothrix schenckii 1099-18]
MNSSPRSDADAPPPRWVSQGPHPQVHNSEPDNDRPSVKRRKRDGNDLRQRVTRACDRCKKHCIDAGAICTYDLSYARGRLPSIPLAQTIQTDKSPTSTSPVSATSYGVLASPVVPIERSAVRNTNGDSVQSTGQLQQQHETRIGQQHGQQQGQGQHGQSQTQQSVQPPSEGLSFLSAAAAEMARRPGDASPCSLAVPESAIPLATPPPPPPTAEAQAASSRVSPEPLQTDLQGHYVGPASGVSFLLRVQKKLRDNVSFQQPSSSIFTFGDAPLQPTTQGQDDLYVVGGSDTSLLFLTQPEANALLARYFDFAVPTHRFLHRPTVEFWLSTFYATRGRMTTNTTRKGNNNNGNDGNGGNGRDTREDGRAQAAVLFMVFAQARDYLPASDVSADMDSSAHFYRAAERQLAREKGAIRLASVQARLCQCFYLLSQSRINQCWSLFGTTAHLALAIGLNRNRRADPAGGLSQIDVECRRRTFWCAYSLDNYLSAALGRPRTFHDEDIDQELPSIAEDRDILHGEIIWRPTPSAGLSLGNHSLGQGVDQGVGIGLGMNVAEGGSDGSGGGGSGGRGALRGMSVMLAPVAHVRLSKIVSLILRDLYAIRPISSTTRAILTAKHTDALRAWRQHDLSLARFLDADRVSASLLIPIFQRQRHVLNLAYWHALLLTHRPILLSNFAYLRQGGSGSSVGTGVGNGGGGNNSAPDNFGSSQENARDPDVRAQAQASIQQCVGAAMHIIEIVDDLFQDGQLFRAYWFTMYFAFSAVVVVYVYVIQHQSAPQETYAAYLAAAVVCQGQIDRLAESGSLAQRYSLVLEELRLITLQQTDAFQLAVDAQGERLSTGISYSNLNNHQLPNDQSGIHRQEQHHHAQQPRSQSQQQQQLQPQAVDLSAVPLAGGLIGGLAGGLADWNGSPSNSLADATSWGFFDSMVSSGFWPLDSLPNEDYQLRG